LARLDPVRIGSFHPRDNEDRILLQREDLPELLVKTLIAVEDQHFSSHFGVDPLGILRALLANARSGRMAQGGSTLTQQLVKNFYLSHERSLRRKLNEAIMALLLERRYSKDEILTAYANEIFLGQDRGRAVHGFALASQFYFRRELRDLSPAQIALLVGMIKGPSLYDPRREPQRCLERRQVVLELMRGQGVIGDELYLQAKAAGLEQAETVQSGFNRYPAFLDLVRRQLGEEYREEDLVANGLKILTTLDPQVQQQVEGQIQATLAMLEKRPGSGELECAVVVGSREGGEILALAGGRHALQTGFNRALDARRPIGSLIKPVVYLTALTQGYTLATPVADTALTVTIPGAKDWRPANYDRREHGAVLFQEALAMSYNLSTVRIGMDVGVEQVIANLGRMGIDREFPPYPSFFLGTAELSPWEVARVYQVLATGGFQQPQRAIRAVLTAENTLVQRYGLSVEQRFPAVEVYLLNTALQRVVSHGTARGLARYVAPSLHIAGKTGTTDEMRDSWFAGFSGDRLAVAWIGHDDNTPCGLTGASGALVLWGRIMQQLPLQPLELTEPEGIVWGVAERGERLPFAAQTVPAHVTPVDPAVGPGGEGGSGFWHRLRGWMR
ncbi:MAG: penicillin-binding protein 1B, partial [Desulfobulbaceae bacterium A2]